jgi:hypothetical protein
MRAMVATRFQLQIHLNPLQTRTLQPLIEVSIDPPCGRPVAKRGPPHNVDGVGVQTIPSPHPCVYLPPGDPGAWDLPLRQHRLPHPGEPQKDHMRVSTPASPSASPSPPRIWLTIAAALFSRAEVRITLSLRPPVSLMGAKYTKPRAPRRSARRSAWP